MAEQSVVHSTFVIERNYPQSPERVFAAFADPAKKRRWFAEGGGSTVDEFQMDFRVGGSEQMRYTLGPGTPVAGMKLNNEGTFQEIVPNKRVVIAQTMDLGDKRISAALVTVELLPNGTGTDLLCTHQGAFFEGSDGPKMREGGWRTLFDRLEKELAG
jgi:uncharacterized protein YndB with AHSA1/START domain